MLVEVSCALELEIFPRLSWFKLRLLGFRLRVYIARRMKDVFRVIFNCPGVITSIILTPDLKKYKACLLYTSPSPRDGLLSRMPSSA